MNSRTAIEQLPVIGILRGFETRWLEPILDAVMRGGLKCIEITMNSPEAEKQIRLARNLGEGRIAVGAGTVTDVTTLDRALAAGASFIVTPTFGPEVIRACVRREVPVFPGAFSPTEIQAAWEMGAAMVKVFPAEVLGAEYIQALRGPLPKIKLMPTGGVDLDTLPRLLMAGAAGFGVGSPLFQRRQIETGDWNGLEQRARGFVAAFHDARQAHFPREIS